MGRAAGWSPYGELVADGVEGVLVLFCVGIFSVRCGMKSGGGFAIGKSAGEKSCWTIASTGYVRYSVQQRTPTKSGSLNAAKAGRKA